MNTVKLVSPPELASSSKEVSKVDHPTRPVQGKILVRHVRGTNRVPIATLVALSPTQIGYAFLHYSGAKYGGLSKKSFLAQLNNFGIELTPDQLKKLPQAINDIVSKKRAVDIAYGRAVAGKVLSITVPNHKIQYRKYEEPDNPASAYIDVKTNLRQVFPEILNKFKAYAEKYFGNGR